MRITKGGRSIEVNAAEIKGMNDEIRARSPKPARATVEYAGVLPIVTRKTDPAWTAARAEAINSVVDEVMRGERFAEAKEEDAAEPSD